MKNLLKVYLLLLGVAGSMQANNVSFYSPATENSYPITLTITFSALTSTDCTSAPQVIKVNPGQTECIYVDDACQISGISSSVLLTGESTPINSTISNLISENNQQSSYPIISEGSYSIKVDDNFKRLTTTWSSDTASGSCPSSDVAKRTDGKKHFKKVSFFK